MEEKTVLLIAKLAEKLGTTSEYLWDVLISQASISATISLIQIIFVYVVGFIIYRVHIGFMKKPPDDEYNDTYYEKYGVDLNTPMCILTLIWFIVFVVCTIACITDIIN